jgi:hypothetical protein
MERRRLAAGPRSPPGARAPLARLQRDMDRRRAGGVAALLRRVRWGNVGWLIALLAAGSLLLTGGGGDWPAGPTGALEPANPPGGEDEARQRRSGPPAKARGRESPKPDRRRRARPPAKARERRRPKLGERRRHLHGARAQRHGPHAAHAHRHAARTHQRPLEARPTQTGEAKQSNLGPPAEQVSSPVAVVSPSPPPAPPPPVPRSGEFSPDPRLP